MAYEEQSLTQEDIAEFTKKLERWSKELPEKERALVELITARARVIDPSDVVQTRVDRAITSSLRSVIDDISKRFAPEGWVRIDPIWYKKNDDLGEDVEIISRSTIRLQGE